MKAVHFGAGNIGRGFIGDVLSDNNFEIVFVDVNPQLIQALQLDCEYPIHIVGDHSEIKYVRNVTAINSQRDPDGVTQALSIADLITCSVGPNNLKYIAGALARGIEKRYEINNVQPLDVIACENMLNGSHHLRTLVVEHLNPKAIEFMEYHIGFPNAAVDRIVPEHHGSNLLEVKVESFKEWIIETQNLKNSQLKLEGVIYVDAILPFVERKLFSVNTGHASIAYMGLKKGHTTMVSAMNDPTILDHLRRVLDETRNYLIHEYHIDKHEHDAYIQKLLSRFSNKYIDDSLDRIARTPIRKLGYDERFVKPIRKLKEAGLRYDALLETVALAFTYYSETDAESQKLQAMRDTLPAESMIAIVTGLTDPELINEIENVIDAQ